MSWSQVEDKERRWGRQHMWALSELLRCDSWTSGVVMARQGRQLWANLASGPYWSQHPFCWDEWKDASGLCAQDGPCCLQVNGINSTHCRPLWPTLSVTLEYEIFRGNVFSFADFIFQTDKVLLFITKKSWEEKASILECSLWITKSWFKEAFLYLNLYL